MKFVLHSRERDKIHLLILRRSRSRGFRAGLIGMRHSSQSYFQCRTKFVCNLPDTSEISYQNENFIQIENRNEHIPEWLVREQNVVSVSCKQIQRNIWK